MIRNDIKLSIYISAFAKLFVGLGLISGILIFILSLFKIDVKVYFMSFSIHGPLAGLLAIIVVPIVFGIMGSIFACVFYVIKKQYK